MLVQQTDILTKCQLAVYTKQLFQKIAKIKWRNINEYIDVELFPEEEVRIAVHCLNSKKVPGPEEIPPGDDY